MTIDADTSPAPVLVAEDDPRSLRMITLMFQSLGIPAVTVPDGRAAIEALTPVDAAFRAVVLDMQMPRATGVEVTRWIRAQEHTRTLPVVIVTAFAYPQDEAAARAAGADHFLTKPLSLEMLTDAMRQIDAGR